MFSPWGSRVSYAITSNMAILNLLIIMKQSLAMHGIH